jgi:K+-transporting ATPase ATPase B chain
MAMSEIIFRGLPVVQDPPAGARGTGRPARIKVLPPLVVRRDLLGPASSSEGPRPTDRRPGRLDPREPLVLLTALFTLLGMLVAVTALVRGEGGAWVACLLALNGCLVVAVLAVYLARAVAGARAPTPAGAPRMLGEEIPAYRLCALGAGEPVARTPKDAEDDGVAVAEYYEVEETASARLRRGDLVLVEAGQVIPADGEIVAGAAMIDESFRTGESAPVLREAEEAQPAVRGGTRVSSGCIILVVTRTAHAAPRG